MADKNIVQLGQTKYEALLKIQDLTVNFAADGASSNAIQNINITVHRGELVAIVGESGSGKSVTSLSILQLLPTPPANYASGKILFTSKTGIQTNLLDASLQQLRCIRGNEIAMIFQEPMTSLNPVFTCGNQVIEAFLLHQKITPQDARQKTLALFEQVKLPDPAAIFKRYPHQLSGGQKQRVMIAMAMSCQPALLICDEPTTALDVTVQKTILELVKGLQQQQNMGVIFITHDLNLVADIADRVVVMFKGNIVEQGPAKDVYLNPKHPYTKALLACRPKLQSKGGRLPIVADFMEVTPTGNIIEVTQKRPLSVIQEPAVVAPEISTPLPLMMVENLNVWFNLNNPFFGKPTQFTKAVNNVSFQVMEGEILGLVGESGCGKTTLGRALLNLIKPTNGKIYYKQNEISGASNNDWKHLRKNMQIIFQDPYSSLNPRLTVGAAIAEPLQVHIAQQTKNERKERVINILEKVGLKAEHYNRYPHEFSGGQRQRIVIARALILNPAFIICDESVSALDASVQAQVLNLLNDLKKEFGFTAIFISHDLSVVRYISNRIMVMHKGSIVETGDADSIYTNPQLPYTKQLIAAIPKGLVA